MGSRVFFRALRSGASASRSTNKAQAYGLELCRHPDKLKKRYQAPCTKKSKKYKADVSSQSLTVRVECLKASGLGPSGFLRGLEWGLKKGLQGGLEKEVS